MANITLKIEGMTCGHCKATVEKVLRGVEGVETALVDIKQGTAQVGGENLNEGALKNAVIDEGYRIKS